MTGSVFRSVAPDTAGGFAAGAELAAGAEVVGLLPPPDAVGLPDVADVDDAAGVLDPHPPSTRAATTATGTKTTRTGKRRTAGRLSTGLGAVVAPGGAPAPYWGWWVDAARIYSVEDARRRAARAVPRALFDYIDGGAEDEVTMHGNIGAFRETTFRPRLALEPGEPLVSTSLFGTPLSIPVLLAPCGLVRFMHPEGAAAVARAAAAIGTVPVLSTVAGSSLEEFAASAPGPKWFQLYSPGGRDQADGLVARAQHAGYTGLVITLDTPALGHRERDVRHGVTQPFQFTPARAGRLAAQVALRPRWLAGMARAELRARAASTGARPAPGARAGVDPAVEAPTARLVAMGASPFTWDDVRAIRAQWTGPLAVKGVLSPDDACRAVEAGSDVVIVSNHGGRQLDGAPPTLRVLPGIVDALGGSATVVLDSGVRRGGDVVKALAAGADAVMIGRAYLYGLAACGEAGVRRVLEILRTEMVRTMSLLGCRSVSDLDRTWLEPPGGI